jgi:hypothetical protein
LTDDAGFSRTCGNTPAFRRSSIHRNLTLVDKCIPLAVLAALHWKLRSKELFWFALFTGLLSTYIAIDDLFCIHEILAPRYLGVPEKLVYVFLSIVIAIYLIIFRRLIFQIDSALLLIAFTFLVFSVFVDVFLMKWLYSA